MAKDRVDRRVAAEDDAFEGRAREEMWARVEVEGTAARDIILTWTLNGARARGQMREEIAERRVKFKRSLSVPGSLLAMILPCF